MSQTARLGIAQRMHALLQRELQQGIDAQRMAADARYARDVLLVCDALHETELPALAQQFRDTGDDDDDTSSRPASLWPDSSLRPPSRWPRSWFRPGRWLRK